MEYQAEPMDDFMLLPDGSNRNSSSKMNLNAIRKSSSQKILCSSGKKKSNESSAAKSSSSKKQESQVDESVSVIDVGSNCGSPTEIIE